MAGATFIVGLSRTIARLRLERVKFFHSAGAVPSGEVNRKSRWRSALKVLIGATCLIALLGIHRISVSDATTNAEAGRNLKQAPAGASGVEEPLVGRREPIRGDRYSALISSRKLDPRVTTLAASGVFSVTRRGSLRPDGDALQFVQSLLAASEGGDAVASYEIFLSTRECAALMRPGVNPAEPREIGRIRECEPLLLEQRLMGVDWLTRAAEQGGIEALLMYGVNPEYTLGARETYLRNSERVSDWKARAARYLEDAAASGSHDALLSLSRAYGNGVIVPGDPVRAYAYALAAHQALSLPYLSELVRQHEDELSRRDQANGRRLAAEIMQGCCLNQPGE